MSDSGHTPASDRRTPSPIPRKRKAIDAFPDAKGSRRGDNSRRDRGRNRDTSDRERKAERTKENDRDDDRRRTRRAQNHDQDRARSKSRSRSPSRDRYRPSRATESKPHDKTKSKPEQPSSRSDRPRRRSRSRSRSPPRKQRRSRSRSRSPVRNGTTKPTRTRSPPPSSSSRQPPSGPSRPSRTEQDRSSNRAIKTEPPTEQKQKPHVNGDTPMTNSNSDTKPISKVNDDEETARIRRLMGFGTFRSTKNTKVPGNQIYGVRKEKKTVYRQYMNRTGGFNRPLSPTR